MFEEFARKIAILIAICVQVMVHAAAQTAPVAPTLSAQFSPDTIPLNSTTSLIFTVANPSASESLTEVAFTNSLPSGLIIGDSSFQVCGGTLPLVAPAQISMAGAALG